MAIPFLHMCFFLLRWRFRSVGPMHFQIFFIPSAYYTIPHGSLFAMDPLSYAWIQVSSQRPTFLCIDPSLFSWTHFLMHGSKSLPKDPLSYHAWIQVSSQGPTFLSCMDPSLFPRTHFLIMHGSKSLPKDPLS